MHTVAIKYKQGELIRNMTTQEKERKPNTRKRATKRRRETDTYQQITEYITK